MKKDFFLRNVDIENRLIKNDKGEWKGMPPDDGYDSAFFFFLQDTNMPFEWLVYNVIGKKSTRGDNIISSTSLLEKLFECGYSPSFLSFETYLKKNVSEYLQEVRKILIKHNYL